MAPTINIFCHTYPVRKFDKEWVTQLTILNEKLCHVHRCFLQDNQDTMYLKLYPPTGWAFHDYSVIIHNWARRMRAIAKQWKLTRLTQSLWKRPSLPLSLSLHLCQKTDISTCVSLGVYGLTSPKLGTFGIF